MLRHKKQLVLTAWLDVAVLPPDEGVHGVAPGAALDTASVPAEVGGVPHLKVTSMLMFQILLPSQCSPPGTRGAGRCGCGACPCTRAGTRGRHVSCSRVPGSSDRCPSHTCLGNSLVKKVDI